MASQVPGGGGGGGLASLQVVKVDPNKIIFKMNDNFSLELI